MIKIVGITGLMGSGKTYISNIFSQLEHVFTFNTDATAKSLQVKNSELKNKIIDKFGIDYYIQPNLNTINKQYVIPLLFSGTPESNENMKWITNTVAPYVLENILKYKTILEDLNIDGIILVESAILFETELNKNCDYTICVKSPNPVMAAYNRDYILKEEWDIRMSTQLPDSEKKYDFIIGNDYTSDLQSLVNTVYSKIMENIS